jgi:hypothetical protein
MHKHKYAMTQTRTVFAKIFAMALVMGLLPLRAQVSLPALISTVIAPSPAAQFWSAAEIARSPMVADSVFVRIDSVALLAVPMTHEQPLAVFDLDLIGEHFTLNITSLEWVVGYRVLNGTVPGLNSEIHLTLSGSGAVWGSIEIESRTFIIAYTGVADVHVVQRIDASRLPAGMRCGINATHAVSAPATGQPDTASNTNCGLTTVDLLVVYTPLSRQNAGGVAAIETAIVGAIAQANGSFINSGVSTQFRLVHMQEVNYLETGSSADLSVLQNPTDGVLDEVQVLRQDYGADLVQMVTDPSAAQYCGIGYLMTNLSTGFSPFAFGVTVRTCISNKSMTHECGHNMGCHHDIANAGPAIYPYSYGYRTPDNVYRTIMSYAPGARVNLWSGPNVQYLGYAMGVAGSADNVLSLQNTNATVANFEITKAPIFCDLGGGIASSIGVPTLTGSGTMNLVQPIELTIRNFDNRSLAMIIIGASSLNQSIFGGVLVPSPDIVLGLIGNGSQAVYNANWMANFRPGYQVWFQAALLGGTSPLGVSASDALKVTIPG